MNKRQLVSVVLPTYNRAHTIRRAIQSVLNQTFRDFELIIVDDASIDNTREMVEQFADPRIRYIVHSKNRGGGAARNTGIKAARGIYAAFQDSDDEWLPEKLEKQMNYLEAAPSDRVVVYTAFLRCQGAKAIYIPKIFVRKKSGDVHEELMKGNFVGTPTLLIRKDLLFNVGLFDEGLPSLQDWDLVIRLSKLYQFFCIDEPLVNAYTSTGSNLSEDEKALEIASRLILEKHYSDFANDAEALCAHFMSIGSKMVSCGNVRKGRMYLLKSFKVYPNINSFVVLCLSLTGSFAYRNLTKIFEFVLNFLRMRYRNLNSAGSPD